MKSFYDAIKYESCVSRRGGLMAMAKKIHPQASDYLHSLRIALAKDEEQYPYDAYYTLALLCREKLIDRWLNTRERYRKNDVKQVYYLSLEFLMGRYLQNSVLNMDIEEDLRQIMHQRGMVLEDIYEEEYDPGLGNGGLGRLAACFLDSMATLDIPATGYGIRYEFGIFRQQIVDGAQVEKADNWLYRGNPWEIARPEEMVPVHFHGRCETYTGEDGRARRRWLPDDTIMALPYDTPVPGYNTDTVNTLRLWEARSADSFSLSRFNEGDYVGAVQKNVEGETISKILYPADHYVQGQELRLKQQYFFVAASLRDILNNFKNNNSDLRDLPGKAAVQLNDTHPTIAIPELMRILIDDECLEWEQAWKITKKTMAYTNHTLLPEALECWSVELLEHLLPRHLELIYEINHHFLSKLRAQGRSDAFISRVSIVGEQLCKVVRMAHLAIVGSHSTNGVAALHTKLLQEHVVADLHTLFPERFNNKTNGVTPRRWLNQANPSLSLVISKYIGSDWIGDLDQLHRLGPLAADADFCNEWQGSKLANKVVLADLIRQEQDVLVDPESLFRVQVKRIHEYKRQLLNLLNVIACYLELKNGVDANPVPQTVMIGGKAAPAYHMAKLIIELCCAVAKLVNNDRQTRKYLQLVFLENYGVSQAERVIPAADLSEQISTAGFEASGTGNMKFSMNGALTIGTMDGANIEIAEAVGMDNIFIFGLSAEEVLESSQNGYDPQRIVADNMLLREVLDSLRGGMFSKDLPGRFQEIYDALIHRGDTYRLLADFASYHAAQKEVNSLYSDQKSWTEMAVRNVAGMGRFSSDRTIREYAEGIWEVPYRVV